MTLVCLTSQTNFTAGAATRSTCFSPPEDVARTTPTERSIGFARAPRPYLLVDEVHHCRVEEGGYIAELPMFGDVLQEAPHDLAATGFGQVGRQDDLPGFGDGPYDLGHVRPQRVHQRATFVLLVGHLALDRDEGHDRLSGGVVAG